MLKLIAVLALAGIVSVAVAWFFMRDAITAKVLDLVESRLAKNGLYLERGSHELTWNQGVVLRGLSLFADEDKSERVAFFDHLGVRIPIREILNDNPRLVLGSERGYLRIETSDGPLTVEQLDFKLVFSDGALLIDHLGGSVNGLRVTSEGGLKWMAGGAARKFEVPDFAPLSRACRWIDFPKGGATLATTVNSRDAGGLDFGAVFSGEDFQWRNLMIERANVPVVLGEKTVELPGASVDCYGGNVSADLVLDYENARLRVTKVVSSAEPFRLIGAIMGGGALSQFGTNGVTVMSGEDITFDLRKFSDTRGVFQVKSPGGLLLPLAGRKVALRGFEGEARFAEEGLVVVGRKFSIFGGASSGRYQMPLSGGFRYRLNVENRGVSLPDLGRAFGMKEDLKGLMDVTFDGGGARGVRSLHSKGRVSVRGGHFYSVPFFGSLRSALMEKSPEFGKDVARDLSAGYALKNGVLSSDDLQIESSGTVMRVRGQTDLVAKSVDVDVRANLKGVVGVATALVSVIFELHGEGSWDQVAWSMANAPKIPKAAGDAVDGVGNAVEGVLKGVGDSAGKVIKGLGGLGHPRKKK